MKRGHSNKWSPRHKYISACITNIEIPEEISVFTGLKTLTEKDSERFSDAFFLRAAGLKEEAAQEHRGNLTKRRAKQSSNELVR